ncbi:phosphohydrolase [Gammaproteobacteria bacterium 42_54_T18]|nr:phosphohydrolase [Gammaproteobacteria bacterium 42_54_T18]
MTEHIKTQILTTKLQLGMHVIELDKPWLDSDFLLQGFVIQSQDEIDALNEQCGYVYIDGAVLSGDRRAVLKKRSNSTRKKEIKPKRFSTEKFIKEGMSCTPSPENAIRYVNKINVQREMPLASSTYKSAKVVAKNIIEGIRIGKMLDLNEAKAAVNDIVDSLLRNGDALVWLTKIKEKDAYTAEHSLNVCILSIAFARFLGHEDADIRKIGLCGLLHDVGKSKIPIDILNKFEHFTDEEFVVMKGHPELGRDLLLSLPTSDLAVIDVAYSHHERIDGHGYPRQLSGHQIPYFAKIVALTDAYDAITSTRCYDVGRASMEALDIIYKNKGSQFDRELAVEFIKCIGIYPPGSIVEMTNGEVGIIVEENESSKLRPKVILVQDQSKHWMHQHIIDLSLRHLDPGNVPYTIAHEVPNGTYGIDIKQFLKKGLVLKKAVMH